MRAVFLGTPDTAVPSLEALLAAGVTVPLVVTQPDRPAGRSRALRPPPVKVCAERAGLPVLQPARVRTPEFAAAIADARPDVLAVVAYGRILVRPVLDAAPSGAVNVHFSLLPRYRGAAPVAWALANGETTTGVTTFRLDEGLDTGPILMQRAAPIAPEEHAPSLLARLARVGADLLVATLAALERGTAVSRPQDDAAATLAPLLRREDGYYDPAWTAAELSGRVRGFDPWPGVWGSRGGGRVRIVETAPLAATPVAEAPGTVLQLAAGRIGLACGTRTAVELVSVQPESGRAMTAAEAIRGRRLAVGDRLERPRPPA